LLLVIDRYLTKEILQAFVAVVVVLLLIFSTRHFVLFLADAASGKISSEIVLNMLALRTITSLSVILPFGLYIAVLLAFGRLYKDSEMTALSACGVGPVRVIRTVFLVSVACSMLVVFFSFWATPWAHEKVFQVREQAQAATPFATVSAGQFSGIGHGRQVFYVEKLTEDRSRLEDVFVQSQETNGRMDVFSARSGHQTINPKSHARYLVLVDGYRYLGTPGSADFTIQKFKKNAIRLEQKEIVSLHRTRWATPTQDLWNSDNLLDQAEFQSRFSMPLATLLLAVLAVLLSRTSPRQGRFSKLFIAVLVFITYYNTLGVAQSWLARGEVPIQVGVWWVHICLLVVMATIAIKYWGWRPFTQQIQVQTSVVKKIRDGELNADS
jgi:lipopolysaccharide export system permease protein